MKNKKGFTLVELLASLVILGLLTAVAAPNIIGILQSTKTETYVTDAKKLSTLAEYRFRKDNTIKRPNIGQCVLMTMSNLGTSEFKKPPYGGTYEDKKSFAVVCKENVTVGGTTTVKYVYYVQIIEKPKKDEPSDPDTYNGILLTKVSDIKQDQVKAGLSTVQEPGPSTTSLTKATGGNLNNIIQRYF